MKDEIKKEEILELMKSYNKQLATSSIYRAMKAMSYQELKEALNELYQENKVYKIEAPGKTLWRRKL